MANAIELQIADAIVADLNNAGRSWNGAFTAQRVWLPVYQPSDVQALKVSVIPLTIAEEKASRSAEQMDYGIGIDFQQLVDPTNVAALDALNNIAASVHDFYRLGYQLSAVPGATILYARREDVYDLNYLYTDKIWETLIAGVVRIMR